MTVIENPGGECDSLVRCVLIMVLMCAGRRFMLKREARTDETCTLDYFETGKYPSARRSFQHMTVRASPQTRRGVR